MTQDKMNNQWEEKAREAVYKNLCYPMKDGYYLKGSLRTDDVINCLAKLAESEYLRGRETMQREAILSCEKVDPKITKKTQKLI